MAKAARINKVVARTPRVWEGALLRFQVALTAERVQSQTEFAIMPRSSAKPEDYFRPTFSAGVTLQNGRLIIPANVSTFAIFIDTKDDAKFEHNETITLRIGSEIVTATIANDDRRSANITNLTAQSVREGGNLIFNVTMAKSAGPTQAVLKWGIDTSERADMGGILATKGVTFSEGKLNIPPNVTNFQVIIPTKEDAVNEGHETVQVFVGNKAATAMILNDDRPAANVLNISGGGPVVEGGSLIFTVTVAKNAKPTSATIAFGRDLALADDLGRLALSKGITVHEQKLMIPANVTTFRVVIPTVDDKQKERNESVILKIGSKTGNGTIVNNDRPAANITSLTAKNAFEGANLIFNVTMAKSAGPTQAVLMWGIDTSEWVDIERIFATNGVTFSEGRFKIPPSVTHFQVIIRTTEDRANEGHETVRIFVGNKAATAMILNDDRPAANVLNISGGGRVAEGGTLIFTVTVAKNAKPTSATIAFGRDLALPDDLGRLSLSKGVMVHEQKLMIPANVTTFRVVIPTVDDNQKERNESVILKIGSKTGAGTIVNDDRRSANITNLTAISAFEGANLIFNVTMAKSAGPTQAVLMWGIDTSERVDMGRIFATNGVTFSEGKLNIPPNVTNFQVIIRTTEDGANEGPETVRIFVGNKAATATILNDDRPAANVLNISGGGQVAEGGRLIFTVTVAKNAKPTSATIAFGRDLALPGDLGRLSLSNGVMVHEQKLMIPANVTTFNVVIPTVDDKQKEGNESVILKIGSKTGAGTIVNDDSPAAKITRVFGINAHEGDTLIFHVGIGKSAQATRASIRFGNDTSESTDLGKIRFTNGVILSEGELLIPANVTDFQIIVPAKEDEIPEGDETVSIQVGDRTGTATIKNGRDRLGWYDDAFSTLIRLDSQIRNAGQQEFNTYRTRAPSDVMSSKIDKYVDALSASVFSPELSNIVQRLGRNATGRELFENVDSLVYTKRIKLRTDIQIEAAFLYDQVRAARLNFSPSGSSADILGQIQAYSLNFTEYLYNIRDHLSIFMNLVKQFTDTMSSGEGWLVEADKDFLNQFKPIAVGGTVKTVSMDEFFELVADGFLSVADTVKENTDKMLAAYQNKVADENIDAVLHIISAVIFGLDAVSVGANLFKALGSVAGSIRRRQNEPNGAESVAEGAQGVSIGSGSVVGAAGTGANYMGLLGFSALFGDMWVGGSNSWRAAQLRMDNVVLNGLRIFSEAERIKIAEANVKINNALESLRASGGNLTLNLLASGAAGDTDRWIDDYIVSYPAGTDPPLGPRAASAEEYQKYPGFDLIWAVRNGWTDPESGVVKVREEVWGLPSGPLEEKRKQGANGAAALPAPHPASREAAPLAALAGADIISGGAGDDVIDGGPGDDTLTGGAGSDRFVFTTAGFGHDVVTDFEGGTGAGDVLEFTTAQVASWAALLSKAKQVGSDTVLSLSATESVTLKQVTLATLQPNDVRFV